MDVITRKLTLHRESYHTWAAFYKHFLFFYSVFFFSLVQSFGRSFIVITTSTPPPPMAFAQLNKLPASFFIHSIFGLMFFSWFSNISWSVYFYVLTYIVLCSIFVCFGAVKDTTWLEIVFFLHAALKTQHLSMIYMAKKDLTQER